MLVIVLYLLLCSFMLGFECNMIDDMLVKLGENGGVVMINFGLGFVIKEVCMWSDNCIK